MTVQDVQAFAAVGSMIVAIIAAGIAFWSARASATSARNAAAVARRTLARDVAIAAQQIVDLAAVIANVSEQSKMQQAALCALTGNSLDGSARQLFVAKVDGRLSSIANIRDEAAAIAGDYAKLSQASEDDLSAAFTKFSAGADRLRAIHAESIADLAHLQAQSEAARQRRQSAG